MSNLRQTRVDQRTGRFAWLTRGKPAIRSASPRGKLVTMRSLAACLILRACPLSFAAGDTNIIVLSEWSEPISLRNDQLHDQAIRGRLLIVEGMPPAYGGPPSTNGAMTFVELQNVTPACCDDIEVFFDVMKLNCVLTDVTGEAVTNPVGPWEWGGRGPFPPTWVTLPYNSTIRLFVNGGTRDPLTVYPNGEPWRHWSIAATDTNTYFLSGTLSLSTHTNLTLSPPFREMDYEKHGTATMTFPTTRISAAWSPGSSAAPAQAVLDELNYKAENSAAWRSEFDRLERPEVRPSNYVVSGECAAFVRNGKERLATLGFNVRWNDRTSRYELMR